MIIKAKFESICPSCEQRINVGDDIDWEKGGKAKHEQCKHNEEYGHIKDMSDEKIMQAVIAMVNTINQGMGRAPLKKRQAANRYKNELVKEWEKRHGERRMFA